MNSRIVTDDQLPRIRNAEERKIWESPLPEAIAAALISVNQGHDGNNRTLVIFYFIDGPKYRASSGYDVIDDNYATTRAEQLSAIGVV